MKKLIFGVFLMVLVIGLTGCTDNKLSPKGGLGQLPVDEELKPGIVPETEYKYEIKGKEDYDLNTSASGGSNGDNADVVEIRAFDGDKGLAIVNYQGQTTVETGRVLAMLPEVRGVAWDIWYEDEGGILVNYTDEGAGTSYRMAPYGEDMTAIFGYVGETGDIELHGELLSGNFVNFKMISPGECDGSGFSDFGYYEDAEYHDLLIFGDNFGGYYGHSDENLSVGDYLVIENPEENFDANRVKLSFFI